MVIYIALELIMILAYLYKQTALGLAAWGFIVYYLMRNKRNTIDLFVKCLIASIPTSYLEITGEIGAHIFKIYNFTIFFLVIYLIYYIQTRKLKINKTVLLVFYIVLLLQFIRTLLCVNLPSALIELMQEYIIILPTGLMYIYYNNEPECQGITNDSTEWIDLYYYTTIATSLGVLYQFLLFTYTSTGIGFLTIWRGRQVFDLLFTGYSVLTVYLGGGMIIAMSKLLRGEKTFTNLCILLLIGISCAINSARSGLLSAVVVILIMLIFAFFEKKNVRYALFYGIPVLMLISYIVSFLISHRQSLQVGGLLFANNRENVAQFAFDLMENNLLYFWFGTGINGAQLSGVSQHNMFLEMWTLNGTLFLIPFVLLVISLLYMTRRNSNRFLLWQLFIGHQFISSLFASTFIVPILIIVLCSNAEQRTGYYVNPGVGNAHE